MGNEHAKKSDGKKGKKEMSKLSNKDFSFFMKQTGKLFKQLFCNEIEINTYYDNILILKGLSKEKVDEIFKEFHRNNPGQFISIYFQSA